MKNMDSTVIAGTSTAGDSRADYRNQPPADAEAAIHLYCCDGAYYSRRAAGPGPTFLGGAHMVRCRESRSGCFMVGVLDGLRAVSSVHRFRDRRASWAGARAAPLIDPPCRAVVVVADGSVGPKSALSQCDGLGDGCRH